MAGRRRRRRTTPVVALLVGAMVLLAVLYTAQDRYGHDLGLPEVSVPTLSTLIAPLSEIAVRGNSPPEIVPAAAPATPAQGTVSVHFIDVGQGDSTLIIAPDKTVLIDGGDNGWGPTVLAYLRGQGVSEIDILIATHPHADHIGGLIDVIRELPIGEVIAPELPDALIPTTRTYTNFLLALLERSLSITPAQVGDTRDLGGGAVLTIHGPVRDYAILNDMSVVSRLKFGETSFLFTGDAELAAEHDLATAGGIRSTVLHIGHHGSRTSTTEIFLAAVSPSIAVIPCGLDNQYGHPHRSVIERLNAANIRILRTDLDGTVVLTTDGHSIGVRTER